MSEARQTTPRAGTPASVGHGRSGDTPPATIDQPKSDLSKPPKPDLSKLPSVSATSRVFPTFTPLKWTSFFHSCVYTSLLLSAFAFGKPEPLTDVLGWTHGLLWIGMSLACIAAARMRVVSLRLAVAVAVLGGIGPFFGSYEFVRAQRAQGSARRRTQC